MKFAVVVGGWYKEQSIVIGVHLGNPSYSRNNIT